MYTLRQFMRMNGTKKQDIEDFVVALAGRKLSMREIRSVFDGIANLEFVFLKKAAQ